MKISLNWLQLFTPANYHTVTSPLRDIAHMYSIHTAEIEGVRTILPIDKVIVGRIITAARHPESTKLWVCEVHVGFDIVNKEIIEVILTGAHNVSEGMFVPVALVGAQLSPDFIISERKMAGMLSRGMLCGSNEIGLLEHDTGGIQDLTELVSSERLSTLIGTSVFELQVEIPNVLSGSAYEIPVVDAIFEIDNKNITNRPDLFGIYGHARELSALTGIKFSQFNSYEFNNTNNFPVEIATPHVFSYAVARLNDVQVCKAPFGIRMLLERSGHTTHDAIVDMTNYVMMECGQPLHAFDADSIDGKIVVRQAIEGETIVALDRKEYSLTSQDIVIADASKVLAIAGIMGGLKSGISSSTKNICIESAVFDPVKIRLTAQRLGLRSDASTRFEKSLDPHFSNTVLGRACEVLNFSKVGGNLVAYSSYVSKSVVRDVMITLSHAFILSRIGISLSIDEIEQYLLSLGFGVKYSTDGIFQISIPSHRASKDITIPEDIVEEIARLIGYDKILELPMTDTLEIVSSNGNTQFRILLQDYFRGVGMFEAYNYSFSNEQKDELAGLTDQTSMIYIKNAVSADYTCMKRSLAPLLFQAIHTNLKLSDTVSFFEIAKVHNKNIDGSFEEKKVFGGVFSHSDAKSIRLCLDGLFSRLNISGIQIETGANLPFLHPMVSSTYLLEGIPCVRFGKIHPKTAMNFCIPESVWYFECEYEILFQKYQLNILEGIRTYVEPNRYPTITRELNFVMNDRQSTNFVGELLSSVDLRVQNVMVIDVFVNSEKIGEGKKSVTFRFSIVDRTKTITDEEALQIQNECISRAKNAGFILRTS